ncbi:Rv3235 family protein [Candidatus Blastococcus massiliensis]|uniref:Rv3235 family protein n=1 Tax=Candidatus Blastococcus massiliensis TaxID=1470358 RepID=UPI0004BB250F|nr:Rv3235 family protein [Candidatus Blastococcus massiliensis]
MTVPVHPPAPPATDGSAPSRPSLRLVRVATPQPPLQDERLPVRLVLPGVAVPRPPHRPGPRPRSAASAFARQDEFGPAWSARDDLPPAGDAGRRVLTLALEALSGRRPVTQLQPVTSPGLFAALSGRRPPRWCAEGTAPLLVGPVHVCEPVDGVAEVSAVARRGGRAHAVAARLEGVDGRWRCTALQIG